MSVTSSSTIVGVFGNRAVAEQTIDALANAGFEHENMHTLVPGSAGRFFAEVKSFFTGSEPASNGNDENLVHDLMNMGLSNEQAQYYAQAYNQGYTLLAVKAAGREQDAMNILYQYGATQQQVANSMPQSSYENPNYASNASGLASQETEEHLPVGRQQAMTPPRSEEAHPAVAPLTPRYGLDTSAQQATDETFKSTPVFSENANNTPTYSNDVDTPEKDASYNKAESSTSQAPEQLDGVNMPAYQMAEHEDEMATPMAQQDHKMASSAYQAPEQLDEFNTPIHHTDEDEMATPIAQQADKMANATYQTPGQEDEFDTPTYPTGMDTPEQADEHQTPVYQSNLGMTATPEAKDVYETGMPQTGTGSMDHETHLQQLLEQVQNKQQELQETKAQLESARQQEMQYQTARQQLQELHTELQSAAKELQQTKERIAQYHR